jgi:hypothetical protein
MTKKDIIQALESFNDDDRLILGSENESPLRYAYELKPKKVCGGSQYGMGYFCVLPHNHAGSCYCSNKDVEFEQDKMTYEQFLAGDYND